MAYGLTQDIKDLYIRVKTSQKSPIEYTYAGYTVFPGIDPLLVSLSLM
jgi:hypothetical protein